MAMQRNLAIHSVTMRSHRGKRNNFVPFQFNWQLNAVAILLPTKKKSHCGVGSYIQRTKRYYSLNRFGYEWSQHIGSVILAAGGKKMWIQKKNVPKLNSLSRRTLQWIRSFFKNKKLCFPADSNGFEQPFSLDSFAHCQFTAVIPMESMADIHFTASGLASGCAPKQFSHGNLPEHELAWARRRLNEYKMNMHRKSKHTEFWILELFCRLSAILCFSVLHFHCVNRSMVVHRCIVCV